MRVSNLCVMHGFFKNFLIKLQAIPFAWLKAQFVCTYKNVPKFCAIKQRQVSFLVEFIMA